MKAATVKMAAIMRMRFNDLPKEVSPEAKVMNAQICRIPFPVRPKWYPDGKPLAHTQGDRDATGPDVSIGAGTLEMPGPDAEEAPMRGIKRRRVIVIDDELAGAATKDAEDAEDAMKDADVEEEANKDKRHKKDVKKTT